MESKSTSLSSLPPSWLTSTPRQRGLWRPQCDVNTKEPSWLTPSNHKETRRQVNKLTLLVVWPLRSCLLTHIPSVDGDKDWHLIIIGSVRRFSVYPGLLLNTRSILYISLNFAVFLGISLNSSALFYISLHFSAFIWIYLKEGDTDETNRKCSKNVHHN